MLLFKAVEFRYLKSYENVVFTIYVDLWKEIYEADSTQNANVICKTFVQRQVTLEAIWLKGGGLWSPCTNEKLLGL